MSSGKELDSPLAAPPVDSPTLLAFLQQFDLDPRIEADSLLSQVAAAYAKLPYENLTKIIKESTAANAIEARRGPAEVIADHIRWGAGGTCFALAAALLHLVRALGWQAEPILADRRYGANTHCALLVWIDGRPHLLDPGYLIVEPLPVFEAGSRILRTVFNYLVLTARDDGKKIDLATIQHGQTRYRLTFKTEPVDPDGFLNAWDACFGFDRLRYPVLSKVLAHRQLYLQRNRLLMRSHDESLSFELPPEELAIHLKQHFGVDHALADEALAILRRRDAIP